MASTSNKRSIDDLELEECCRAVKRMAIRWPPATLESVDGDKITTTAAKSKKKPWRLQMQPKDRVPQKKTTQQSCSPLKALEEQISVMLKAIRNSCPNIEETKTKAVEVDLTPNPTKRGKPRMKGARKKPYQKSGGEDNKRKNPEKDIPVAPLPVLVAPPSYNLLRSESTCTTTKTKKIKCTKTISSVTADVACSSSKNTDKAGNATHKRKHHRQSAKSSIKKRRMIPEDSSVEELISKFAELAL
ncbi:uncharacterized protein LOC128190329 [Crassostrea angulata]|uniref:uncharacterized protein LOC128190329 n=1 Tax=Magallana angulata TaxID=2784310 RepID=UPI0022B1DD08|nr:uncharacterized protein LOC128190329 [Crassostrea angulata]